MSATERQRRWRAKLRASKPVLKPVERLQASIYGLENERAALRAELETVHVEVTRFMRAWAGSWSVMKARVHELETELARERDRCLAPIDPDSLPKRHREKLKFARQRQDRTFEDRVKQEAHRLLDEVFLASFARDDAHNSLDNVLDGREPLVTKTGYQALRPVPGAARRGARATKR
jgi:hypothetical protein